MFLPNHTLSVRMVHMDLDKKGMAFMIETVILSVIAVMILTLLAYKLKKVCGSTPEPPPPKNFSRMVSDNGLASFEFGDFRHGRSKPDLLPRVPVGTAWVR